MLRVAIPAAGVALGSSYLLSDASQRQRAKALAEASWRASQLLGTAAVITADYKYSAWKMQDDPGTLAVRAARERQNALDIKAGRAEIAWRKATEEAKGIKDRQVEPRSGRKATQLEQNLVSAQDMVAAVAEAEAVASKSRKEAADAALAAAAAKIAANEAQGGFWDRVHERNARRMLRLCRENAGVYIKLGQHLAQLDFILPEQYPAVLRELLDDAPQSSYESVRAVVREELGANPEDLFDGFEPQPIASASLAQVHVAYDKQTGRKLAVKVQHRGLRETSAGDIDAVTLVVNFIADCVPAFQFRWLATEIAPHLPLELDFVHEADNAERCAALIAEEEARQSAWSAAEMVVPRVYRELTTPRVLTMEFEEGCNITDVDAIEAMGLRTKDVARILSESFCRQMFLHGFVHCDPHPANVLVRAHPGDQGRGKGKGKAAASTPGGRGGGGSASTDTGSGGTRPRPQLVLLDHGLYKQLDESFRLQYAELWEALVLARVETIRQVCLDMGTGELYPLFAAMLTARPWDDVVDPTLDSLVTPHSEADKLKIKGYAQQYAVHIAEVLNRVPRQMLLLFKTNDCLRHTDRVLGTPVNTFLIVAGMCVEALAREQEKQQTEPSLRSTLGVWWQRLQIRVAVWLFLLQQWAQTEAPQLARALALAVRWLSQALSAQQQPTAVVAAEQNLATRPRGE